ncbi:MAG: glycosyltransferase [Chthoniobacteraceae bacterium]
MTPPLRCAVMIATHNRLDELRRTAAVVQALDPAPDEVLVTADACTDGTVEFLRRDWPTARLFINETGLGSTASRDAMMRAATCDLVLSLDDDSYPAASDALARVRAIFAARPRLAVASFPQRTNEDPRSLEQTDFGPASFVGTYVNCACAFRRHVFLDLGGHFAPFWNAYDEPDFAARCVAAGWEVRWEPSVIIRHHYSGVNRHHQRIHARQACNELWSVLLRCPAPQLFAVATFRLVRQLGYAWRQGVAWVVREPGWWLTFLRGLPRCLALRRPLPWRRYLAWMKLVHAPIVDEAEWARHFGAGAP